MFYRSILRVAGWKAGTWPLLQPLLQSRWKWSVWIFSLMTTEASLVRILRQQMFRIQIFNWSWRSGSWFNPDPERQKWPKSFMFRAYVLFWRAGGVSCSFRTCHKGLRINAFNTVSYRQIWNFCSFCDFFQPGDFCTVLGFTEKWDTDSDTMDPKHCWQEPLLYKQPIRYILLTYCMYCT